MDVERLKKQFKLMEILVDGCRKHPAYRAIRPATGNCEPCVKMWLSRWPKRNVSSTAAILVLKHRTSNCQKKSYSRYGLRAIAHLKYFIDRRKKLHRHPHCHPADSHSTWILFTLYWSIWCSLHTRLLWFWNYSYSNRSHGIPELQ